MQNLPEITIKVVPHSEQRYNTCGDYWQDQMGAMQFRVSQMNADYEFLILIHELGEWYLTQRRGVTIKEIDDFDVAFEKTRINEPGDDPAAPYHDEHDFMTAIERILANKLSINWQSYSDAINAL